MDEGQSTVYRSTDAVALIADKWTLPIFSALRQGNKRFGQMQRSLPSITRKMLTQTLRKLERDGLLQRIDYHEVPSRVEYVLTSAGESLLQRLMPLCQWANEFIPAVEEARGRFDSNPTA